MPNNAANIVDGSFITAEKTKKLFHQVQSISSVADLWTGKIINLISLLGGVGLIVCSDLWRIHPAAKRWQLCLRANKTIGLFVTNPGYSCCIYAIGSTIISSYHQWLGFHFSKKIPAISFLNPRSPAPQERTCCQFGERTYFVENTMDHFVEKTLSYSSEKVLPGSFDFGVVRRRS